ncbi:MAG: methenyltetrahydromethanopterin cyclohydrolase [Pirellulaceae bacterium]
MSLNRQAAAHIERLLDDPAHFRAEVSSLSNGATVVDCGAKVRGGLAAGKLLAEACLAGLANVELANGNIPELTGPSVSISTDAPVRACMASQYAGWSIAGNDYFAMGSGPMRAAYCQEEIFHHLGISRDESGKAVGILETAQLPNTEIADDIAKKCGVNATDLILLVARTASIAGSIQVVARSVETALHKMHELKFDLHRVVSGYGIAPLPPVAKNDLAGIGRTNDAVLYGGQVTLWITGDDESLVEIGAQTPSSSSNDFGRPFLEVFASYDYDFYKIDPLLFSPAQITLVNIDTGNTHRFGSVRPDILQQSFYS